MYKRRRLLRISLVVFSWIGTLCALHTSLYKGLYHAASSISIDNQQPHVQSGKTESNARIIDQTAHADAIREWILDNWHLAVLITVVFFIHRQYVRLVVRDHVTSRPLTQPFGLPTGLTVTLCLAYIVGSVEAILGHEHTLWSIFGFFAVYVLWIIHDLSAGEDPQRELPRVVWVIVDLLSALILALAIASHWSPWLQHRLEAGDLTKFSWMGLGIKEIIVGASVIVWLLADLVYRLAGHEAHASDYKHALSATTSGPIIIRGDAIAVVRSHFANCKQLSILDFACSDSSRSIPLAAEFLPAEIHSNWLRYDCNKEWSDMPPALPHSRFSHIFDDVLKQCKDIDVVFASHVLGDPVAVDALIEVVKRLKANSVVIIREPAPFSPAALISTLNSTDPLNPSFYHLGLIKHLDYLKRNTGLVDFLEPLNNSIIEGTVGQITSKFQVQAIVIEPLRRLIGRRFSRDDAEQLATVLTSLVEINDREELFRTVMSNDFVYLLAKNKPTINGEEVGGRFQTELTSQNMSG